MILSRRTLLRIQQTNPENLEIKVQQRPVTGQFFSALFEKKGTDRSNLILSTYPRFRTEEEAIEAMERYVEMCREMSPPPEKGPELPPETVRQIIEAVGRIKKV